MLSDTNGWLHTGETEEGLQIWAKEYIEQDTRYLHVEYRTAEGVKVGKIMDYPVNQVRLLNAVLESLEMEFGVKEGSVK